MAWCFKHDKQSALSTLFLITGIDACVRQLADGFQQLFYMTRTPLQCWNYWRRKSYPQNGGCSHMPTGKNQAGWSMARLNKSCSATILFLAHSKNKNRQFHGTVLFRTILPFHVGRQFSRQRFRAYAQLKLSIPLSGRMTTFRDTSFIDVV